MTRAAVGPDAIRFGKLPLWLTELILVTSSGLFSYLAFAGRDIWPLAFVSIAPFILALRGKSPKRAAVLGVLQGLVMTSFGFAWLLEMLRTFSGFPLPLCLLFSTIVNTYQGGRHALLGWLYARGVQRGYRWDLVFVLALATGELVFPMLFPWYFAACWHNAPLLTQAADLGGPIAVSVIIAFSNTAVSAAIFHFVDRKSAPQRMPTQGVSRDGENRNDAAPMARNYTRAIILTGVAVNLANVVYGAIRIRMVDSRALAGESLKVGFVQGNMGLMQKRENPALGLRRHETMTRELKEAGVDLVVWSESSVTMPMAEENFAVRYKQQLTGRMGVPLLFGAVIYTRQKPERWFNTAIVSNAAGDIDPKKGRYDKQFLLAFGEYLPFGDKFPILYEWSPNSGRFSSGTIDEPLRVEIKGKERAITTLICYEDILPRFTNKLVARADPDFLVNITNDAWFGDTAEPWQHLGLAKFRSIEHRRYLVRSTNSGVSAIIDPVGRTIAHTKTFVPDKGFAVIHMMHGTTGYEIWGDIPWGFATLGSIFLAFKKKKKDEKENEPAAADAT